MHTWIVHTNVIDYKFDDTASKSVLIAPRAVRANASLVSKIRKEGQTFRLRDDDGETYFRGRMIHDNGEELFHALDTLGASYGCTEMQLFENGEYVTV